MALAETSNCSYPDVVIPDELKDSTTTVKPKTTVKLETTTEKQQEIKLKESNATQVAQKQENNEKPQEVLNATTLKVDKS